MTRSNPFQARKEAQIIGWGVIGDSGGLRDYLNRPETERALQAAVVQKARMKEIEALAKALGGKK